MIQMVVLLMPLVFLSIGIGIWVSWRWGHVLRRLRNRMIYQLVLGVYWITLRIIELRRRYETWRYGAPKCRCDECRGAKPKPEDEWDRMYREMGIMRPIRHQAQMYGRPGEAFPALPPDLAPPNNWHRAIWDAFEEEPNEDQGR